MECYNLLVKMGVGKKTTLNREYARLINEITLTNDDERDERWETYDLIIGELFNIDEGKYFEEIKYRLTDNENPDNILLDIVSRYASDEMTYLLWHLKGRVEEYAEEDFFKRFF